MLESKVPIRVRCPICQKRKEIFIPKDVVDNKRSGITSIFIPRMAICEHSFYIYIDKFLKVRDYLVADISITDQDDNFKLDKQEILKEIQPQNLTGQYLFNFISEKEFQSLLYACFINIEILFIEDDLFLDKKSSERFKIIFFFLMQLFPENYNSIKFISTFKFRNYQELREVKTESYVYIFNGKIFANDVVYDKKFEEITEALKNGNFKMQQENSKEILNKLKSFSEYLKPKINVFPENKLLKIAQKKFKNEEISPGTIKLIKRKYEISKDYRPLSEIDSNSIVYVRKVFNNRLIGMGFIRGAKIEVLGNNAGAVTAKIVNTKLALGKNAANQVFVKQY